LSILGTVFTVKAARRRKEAGRDVYPTENRVATATFWHTLHHDGKSSPGCHRWGVHAQSLLLLNYLLVLKADLRVFRGFFYDGKIIYIHIIIRILWRAQAFFRIEKN
jgi:hypothetical protein